MKHTLYTHAAYLAVCRKLTRGCVRFQTRKVVKLTKIVAWIIITQ